jgi:hypothetical protein
MDMAPGAWQSFWRSRLFFTPFEKNEKATPPKKRGCRSQKAAVLRGGTVAWPHVGVGGLSMPWRKGAPLKPGGRAPRRPSRLRGPVVAAAVARMCFWACGRNTLANANPSPGVYYIPPTP